MPIYQTAHYQVNPEAVAKVRAAITDFVQYVAANEPGSRMYTAWQSKDDPTRFVLVEVYRDQEAMQAHRETSHYLKWRDSVASMMSEPRVRETFSNLFPEDKEFGI